MRDEKGGHDQHRQDAQREEANPRNRMVTPRIFLGLNLLPYLAQVLTWLTPGSFLLQVAFRPGIALGLPGGVEDRDIQRLGLAADVAVPGDRMSLQDLQIQRAQGDALGFGPDQQDTRRLGPRHPVTDGDQIIVRFEWDELGLHGK